MPIVKPGTCIYNTCVRKQFPRYKPPLSPSRVHSQKEEPRGSLELTTSEQTQGRFFLHFWMCVSSFFPPLLPETSSKLEKMTSLVQGPKASRVFCLPYESAVEVWRHRASNLDIRPPNLRQGGRLPWWLSAKEFACQHRRHGFDSCSWKIAHAKEQLSLCTTTTSLCSRACEPRLLSPCATATEAQEPVSATREATGVRSPCTAVGE